MMNLPTQRDMQHPHHRRAIFALIGAGVIFAGLIVGYSLNPQKQEKQVDPIDLATQRKVWLEQESPAPSLSQAQLSDRKKFISRPSSEVKLTPDQLQARRSASEI
jgi:hypothetical protein